MNKTLKGIFAGCGVLALLGGGFAALKLTEPQEEENSSVSSEDEHEHVELWSTNGDKDISKIEVIQPDGDTYTAVRFMEHVQSTDLDGNPTEEDIANYQIEGYEKLPMDKTEIRLLATRSPQLTALETVEEEPADLAKYGLDQPITVRFTVDDGDDVEFYIGSKAPNQTYTYLQVKDRSAVYTVGSTSIEPYREPIKKYLGKNVTEAQAEDDETIVKSVKIERSDLDYDMVFEYDEYFKEHTNGGMLALHVMKEPVPALLSPDKSKSATHGLYGLTAEEVCTPFPTKADLKEAGLDKPLAKVTMKTDDKKTTEFLMGKTYENEEGTKLRYGMLKGTDCIYGFSDETVIYAVMKPDDVISKNIFDSVVWDVGEMTCKAGKTKLAFKGKGTSADDYVLTLNGESYENTERFRQLYAFLLQTKAENLVLEKVKPEGKPMAEIYIDRQDHARDYSLKFYDAGGLKAYIEVDGEIRFSCRKSFVETLISNLEIFDDEEQAFTLTW